MIEVEWERQATRAEAAELLRGLADALAGDGDVELEHGGFELKLEVGDELKVEIEAEVDEEETELEIELTWKRGAAREAGDVPAGNVD